MDGEGGREVKVPQNYVYRDLLKKSIFLESQKDLISVLCWGFLELLIRFSLWHLRVGFFACFSEITTNSKNPFSSRLRRPESGFDPWKIIQKVAYDMYILADFPASHMGASEHWKKIAHDRELMKSVSALIFRIAVDYLELAKSLQNVRHGLGPG